MSANPEFSKFAENSFGNQPATPETTENPKAPEANDAQILNNAQRLINDDTPEKLAPKQKAKVAELKKRGNTNTLRKLVSAKNREEKQKILKEVQTGGRSVTPIGKRLHISFKSHKKSKKSKTKKSKKSKAKKSRKSKA